MKVKQQILYFGLMSLGMLLAACNTDPVKRAPVKSPTSAAIVASVTDVPVAVPTFTASKWEMLPEWATLDLTPSWAALLQSCRVLKNKPQWQSVCVGSELVDKNDSAAQRAFYQDHLAPYQVFNPDGSEQGVITGYYEPLIGRAHV